MSETTISLMSMFERMPSMNTLTEAIRRLEGRGHSVELTGDIPGLFRIDDGPELTTNQLIGIARQIETQP